MICRPDSRYGCEKSTRFSSSGVMTSRPIATSASPRSTFENRSAAATICNVESTCIRRATASQTSILKPASGSMAGSTKGAIGVVTTRSGPFAAGAVVAAWTCGTARCSASRKEPIAQRKAGPDRGRCACFSIAAVRARPFMGWLAPLWNCRSRRAAPQARAGSRPARCARASPSR